MTDSATAATQERIEVETSLEAFNALAAERGWSDGLPLVPPTEERVAAALEYCPGGPDEDIGIVPPGNCTATYEAIAANAVMAGCTPEHLPVVIAALDATLDPAFNLYGIQATTNPVGPFVLVGGPAAEELRINAAGNVFGQGWQANATIGRALRLCLLNIGASKPQVEDRATHGFPGKYTFCGAENIEASPWPPYHVEQGYELDDSTVTVFSAQGFHNIIDLTGKSARDILTVMAAGMSAWGTNDMTHGGRPVLVLAPEHAELIAAEGWGKRDVAAFLFEHARFDVRLLPQATRTLMATRRPTWINEGAYPLADSSDAITVLVAGGPGVHGVFIPSFGSSDPITRRLELPDGSPARRITDLRR